MLVHVESCPIRIEETSLRHYAAILPSTKSVSAGVGTGCDDYDFVTLPCAGAQIAHPDCFRQWLESENGGQDGKCPLCRQDLHRSCGQLMSADLLVARTTIPKDALDCPGPEEPEDEDELELEYIEWNRPGAPVGGQKEEDKLKSGLTDLHVSNPHNVQDRGMFVITNSPEPTIVRL
ncbi:uncharacterized protein PG986_008237 [Apiospora aurea]|uniref:RING-type domain-containing protein n=1 Tax=Apiospora aurea TaxID=335848 RepID=A0ABR1QEV3_9PEZI